MARLIDADALRQRWASERDYKLSRWGGYGALLNSEKGRVDELGDCIADVEAAPTVDAKPVVHGRWEWWETMGITFARCSVCDDTVDADAVISFAFCPYCGADMRESKED